MDLGFILAQNSRDTNDFPLLKDRKKTDKQRSITHENRLENIPYSTHYLCKEERVRKQQKEIDDEGENLSTLDP